MPELGHGHHGSRAWWHGLALAGVLGVALQLQQAQLCDMAVYAVAFGSGVVVFLVFGFGWGLRRQSLVWRWFALPALAVTCWAWSGYLAVQRLPTLPPELQGRDFDVQGVVSTMPQKGQQALRFELKVERMTLVPRKGALSEPVGWTVPEQLSLGWYPRRWLAEGMQEEAVPLPALEAGQRWQLRVRLKTPHGQLNPGGFDHELWMWERGLRVTGYVRVVRDGPSPQLLASAQGQWLQRWRQRVRDQLLAKGEQQASLQAVYGVLAALVTGDQAAINPEDWDVFRATGVAHLMSISGLHITMLVSLMRSMVRVLWRRGVRLSPYAVRSKWVLRWPVQTLANVLAWSAGLAYAVFSGWGVPAQRTVLMLGMAMALQMSGRRWPWSLIWLWCALGVLVVDPWALLQAGFWLSFVAVGVLLSSTPERVSPVVASDVQPDAPQPGVVHRVHQLGVSAWGLLREQVLIMLALAPLSVLFFGQWSLVGLLANMVAIVWVSYVVTPLALLGVLVPGVWALSAGLMWPLLQALQAMAQWSSAVLLWPVPPWPLAALALAGAWLFMRPWALGLRLLGVPLVLPLLLWQPWRPALGEFDVWAPDVGQGNAVFVRTQSSTLLYDTGPRYSEYSDAGERVLLPWLDRRREPLSDVVLSHRDTDHTGGVHAVLMRYPGVTLWSSMTVPEDLSRARELRTCAQGRSWRRDGVLFEFIHPQPGYEQIGTATNPGSCVLRISNGQRAVLLVGDIEAAQEAHMVHNQVLSQVDVLLVPHHGSKTSSSEAFLQAVRPRWSWVQAGHMNRYGHPAGAVMARYADLGLPVVRTDWCGALHWRSDVPERTDCWRQQARRYWHDSPP